MPFHGRWPKASSHNAHASESVSRSAQISIQPLVERLMMGSCAGGVSGSFFTNGPVLSVGSATRNTPPRQILNQGVTHTYLIVNTNRRISFTGIASKTVIAK